ncbi:HAD-IIIA family hydrolase [Sphingomonas agri]|uniref:HAD-IIIA family hydrolase n=1 Tax=Sphingomonas agri TaxID=1813878 RepID=UPI00311FFCC4
MKVVVLAGGKGTRLGLEGLPKVLVPIDGTALIERTIASAASQGFTDFLILTGYLGEKIEEQLGDGSRFGSRIEYVREAQPLGTAGCFNQVRGRLTGPFLVVYGDILMDVDFRALAQFALEKGGAGTLFAHPNDHPFDSDLLETDADGRIIAVHPKPHAIDQHYPNLVSAALYVLFPIALDYVPQEGASDWGKDVLPRLAQGEPLYAYRSCEYVKDIGTPERLARAEGHLRTGRVERLALRHRKAAIFVDRDGVINEERDGVHAPGEVTLIEGAAKAIRSFNEAGIPVICVTNQPDLAKGMMSWDDLRAVTGEIDNQLASEAGAYLDDILICPHHPERGWPGEVAELKVECDCRKPRDGLLQEASRMHNIDLKRSWLIGDRYCDIAAAVAAGSRSILVSTGHAGNDRARYSVEPDEYAANIGDAAELILRALP